MSVPHYEPESEETLLIGHSLVDRGYNCCGKPHGCTNVNPGCAYLQHPYKKWARGEIALAELEARNPAKGCES